ncbi:hypothetical protein Tco_1352244 [Tanacetum coccineum]
MFAMLLCLSSTSILFKQTCRLYWGIVYAPQAGVQYSGVDVRACVSGCAGHAVGGEWGFFVWLLDCGLGGWRRSKHRDGWYDGCLQPMELFGAPLHGVGGNNEVKKSTVPKVENKIVNVKSQVIAHTNIGGVGNNEVKKLTTAQVENKIVNDKPKAMADTGNSIGGIGTDEVKNSTASLVENKNVIEKFKGMADTDNTICSIVTSEAKKEIAGQLENKNVNQKLEVMAGTDETIGEGSSKEQRNESNDNSQFEKKTLTVMRGGEMVQDETDNERLPTVVERYSGLLEDREKRTKKLTPQ